MIDDGVNRLPVVDDEQRLIGIITRADLVRAFVRSDAEVEQEIREDVLRRVMWIEPGVVGVEVAGGEVRLTGEVETKTDAEMIPRLVQRVPGVVGVLSKLRWREEDRARSSVLEQALVDRVANEFGPGGQAQLLHDVRPVRLGGAHRDVEHLRDLLVRVAESEEA